MCLFKKSQKKGSHIKILHSVLKYQTSQRLHLVNAFEKRHDLYKGNKER